MRKIGYYQIPDDLWEPQYASVDAMAKLIYGFMLRRWSASKLNGWSDSGGTYIFVSISELSKFTGCSENTVRKFANQLADAGLLVQKRQGQGKPNKVYLPKAETQNLMVKNLNNCGSKSSKSVNQEPQNLVSNYNNRVKQKNTNVRAVNKMNDFDQRNTDYNQLMKLLH